MFKENKRNVTTDTLIGAGTLAEGKMVSEASLRIEGEYRGEIECKGSVIIGEGGVVRSSITAQEVILAGKLFGDVVTSGKLTITPSGHLSGNIMAHSLIIQDGGTLNGTCHMESPAETLSTTASKNKETAQSTDSSDAKSDTRNESRAKSKQAG